MIRLGQRINPPAAQADPAVLAELQGIVTPHLSDNLNRIVGMTGLGRINVTGKLAGTAVTVKTRPGDNLLVYVAMTMIRPGDVLVVDAGGDVTNAIIGELMMRYMVGRGCAGFVIDGAVRDTAAFADVPCYARGVSHRGPYKTGPGEVNVPVSVGGQVVEPGDYLVGDEDGLVSFAPEFAPEMIEIAHRKAAAEQAVLDEIASGAREQSWIQSLLKSAGLDGQAGS